MNGIDFFAELNATTRAHCDAHGFSSAELYGTPPNEAEYETHELIAAGVPSQSAAVPLSFEERMRAEQLRMRKIVANKQRAIRLRNRNYAPGRFINFANRERWIRAHTGD